MYIKDFNRLMFSFTEHKEGKHFCMHCLQCFYSNDALENHNKDCIVIKSVQAIELPKLLKMVKKEYQKSILKIIINNYLFLL